MTAFDARSPSRARRDELVARLRRGRQTARRLFLAAFPQMRIVADAADPLLADAANRALGAARGDLVVLVADDVLLSPGSLERLRDRVRARALARRGVSGRSRRAGRRGRERRRVRRHRAAARARRAAGARARARAANRSTSPARRSFARGARGACRRSAGSIPRTARRGAESRDLVTRLRAAGYGVVALRRRARPPLRCRASRTTRPRPPIGSSRLRAPTRRSDRARLRPCAPRAVRAPRPARSAARPLTRARDRAGGRGRGRARARRARSSPPPPPRSTPPRRCACTCCSTGRSSGRGGGRADPPGAGRERPADGRDAGGAHRASRRPRPPGAPRSSPACASCVAAGHEREALTGLTQLAPRALADLLEGRPDEDARTHQVIAPWSTGTPVARPGAARRGADRARPARSAGPALRARPLPRRRCGRDRHPAGPCRSGGDRRARPRSADLSARARRAAPPSRRRSAERILPRARAARAGQRAARGARRSRFAGAPRFDAARAAGCFGAAPLRDSLARLAPYRTRGASPAAARVRIDAPDAAGGWALLRDRARRHRRGPPRPGRVGVVRRRPARGRRCRAGRRRGDRRRRAATAGAPLRAALGRRPAPATGVEVIDPLPLDVGIELRPRRRSGPALVRGRARAGARAARPARPSLRRGGRLGRPHCGRAGPGRRAAPARRRHRRSAGAGRGAAPPKVSTRVWPRTSASSPAPT